MIKENRDVYNTGYLPLYDLIVDENHILRKIKNNIDFTFVEERE